MPRTPRRRLTLTTRVQYLEPIARWAGILAASLVLSDPVITPAQHKIAQRIRRLVHKASRRARSRDGARRGRRVPAARARSESAVLDLARQAVDELARLAPGVATGRWSALSHVAHTYGVPLAYVLDEIERRARPSTERPTP